MAILHELDERIDVAVRFQCCEVQIQVEASTLDARCEQVEPGSILTHVAWRVASPLASSVDEASTGGGLPWGEVPPF